MSHAVRSLVAGLAVACAIAAPARAESVVGDAAIDVFHADNAGVGTPEVVTAQELGIGAGLRGELLGDDLRFAVRYRGREPLFGDVQNEPLRTLWEAWASYALLDDALTLRVGRFAVPSAAFLTVDGADVRVQLPWGFNVSAFGGRRGLTSSLREAGFDKLLWTGGASAGFVHELVQLDLRADYAQEEAVLTKATLESTAPYGGFDVLGTATSRPFPWLLLGGQIAFVQQGGYALGPTWNDVELVARVIDLWSGIAWTEVRPFDWLRFGYDLHYQRPAVVRTSTVAGAETTLELVDPRFLDNRAQVSVAPLSIGWVRAGVRHRLRPERQEVRYFASLDVDPVVPVGVYGRAQGVLEDVVPFDVAWDPAPDRMLGLLSVGWADFGFDVSTGVSYLERSAQPWSGRALDATAPADLSPFVLEAQRLFFVRASYGAPWWWVAVDAERSIEDGEYRAFAAVGGRLELGW